jgi:hypothetical protein
MGHAGAGTFTSGGVTSEGGVVTSAGGVTTSVGGVVTSTWPASVAGALAAHRAVGLEEHLLVEAHQKHPLPTLSQDCLLGHLHCRAQLLSGPAGQRMVRRHTDKDSRGARYHQQLT